MTVLIIEGPDLSGKGYAIEKIGKFFKRGFLIKNLYKPTKYPDEHIYSQYWGIMGMWAYLKTIENETDIKAFLILDRFFPSQAVYSYLRGHDDMQSEDILELDNECAKNKFIFVYLDTPLKMLEDRYNERGDEHIQMVDLIKLKARYETFYALTGMKKIRLNTLEEGWLNKLSEFIAEVENGSTKYN